MSRKKKQADTREKNAERVKFRAWQTLRWRLTLFVFAIILSSALLTLLVHILTRMAFGHLPFVRALLSNPYSFILIILAISSLIGTVLASAFGVYYLRPLKQLIQGTKEVKKGNFKVQLEIGAEKPENEMDLLMESFNEMVRELDGIELFRNDFINNFSHEFKTPIVSIRGFARQLQREDLTPEERMEYATIIAEESDRLAKLSTSVLELSKLENQQIPGERHEFYLDEQLRQCILLLEPSWSEKALDMIPELEEVKLYSCEEILMHVWKNLLSNAIKFTPEGGTVRVTLTATANDVTVSVSDSGIGMSEDVKNHIFEKFYQGDASHAKRGNGIGLSMAKRAVELCGGRICVESTPGLGSTFTVTLPRKTLVEAEVVEY